MSLSLYHACNPESRCCIKPTQFELATSQSHMLHTCSAFTATLNGSNICMQNYEETLSQGWDVVVLVAFPTPAVDDNGKTVGLILKPLRHQEVPDAKQSELSAIAADLEEKHLDDKRRDIWESGLNGFFQSEVPMCLEYNKLPTQTLSTHLISMKTVTATMAVPLGVVAATQDTKRDTATRTPKIDLK
jgi:hypothetical protein